MLLIIEGVDGSGKTTLIEGLRQRIWPDYIFNYSYPREVEMFQNAANAKGQYQASIKIFKQLIQQGKTIICDRFHLGEYAYGPVMRYYPEWLAKATLDLEDVMIKEIGYKKIGLIFLLLRNSELALVRMHEKGLKSLNLEYLKTIKEVAEVNRRYLNSTILTKLQHKTIFTDDPDKTPEAVLDKVVKFVGDMR